VSADRDGADRAGADRGRGDPGRADSGDAGRPIAVFDIDGVLADVRHRLHHLDARPKNWDRFFEAAVDDDPLTEGLRLAVEMAAAHDIVYLTGRPERTRSDTQRWLAQHGAPTGRLLMRRDGDRRPARVVKLALARQLAARGRLAIVVDDDPDVVEALDGAGLPVRHADWMTRSPALHDAQEREGRT
jgi:phosphoglycolate phosphatase-like HAD superfamily hydrolase